MTHFIVGMAILATIGFGVYKYAQISGRAAVQNQSRPPIAKPATGPRPRTNQKKRPPARPASASRATPKQERDVLQRHLGSAYVAEYDQVILQVRQQEQKVSGRLTQAQRLLDFEELKALHTESRKTADRAYRLMDQARSAARAQHQDKGVVNNHYLRFKADVDRLNQKTAGIRDSINANCGAKGQEWYQALMARTAARREGRL